MALCPFARQRLIPESNTQGRITPRVLIYHEAVSSADSLYNYWTSPGVDLESHFYVYRDGSLDQYVDTNVRADANVDANGFAISVETWDAGGDVNGTWTDAQLATLTRLAAWCEEMHGIPAQVPATWDGRGIGWHNLFADRWAGGPRSCPGPNRALQVRNNIIPAVAAGYDWRNGEAMARSLTDEDLQAMFQYFMWGGRFDGPENNQINFSQWLKDVIRPMVAATHAAVTAPFPSAQSTYDMTPRDALRYVDFVQIKVDAIGAALAAITDQLQHHGQQVQLSDDQLAALKTSVNEVGDQLDDVVERQFETLADALAARLGTGKEVVMSALSDFYGRALSAPDGPVATGP